MLSDREILSTLEMLQNEHLDVRTVTLGISLLDCASHSPAVFRQNLHSKIQRLADGFVETCDRVGQKFGIPVVNKRIAVSPIAVAAASCSAAEMVAVAETLNDIAEKVNVDFIGGFSAIGGEGDDTGGSGAHQGHSRSAYRDRSGLRIRKRGHHPGRHQYGRHRPHGANHQGGRQTYRRQGWHRLRQAVRFCEHPSGYSFMAGAYLGVGEADAVVNVGVSGPA
jgi:uncharacterized protein (UPF0210 family)